MADRKLWAVMRDAYDESDDGTRNDWKVRHGYAAELRAIADEVVPEEPEPCQSAMAFSAWIEKSVRWEQRMATRAKLLKAAAEAEGEA
jgi:hypothetical protein